MEALAPGWLGPVGVCWDGLMEWPMPFSGIKVSVDLNTREELMSFLAWLGDGCRLPGENEHSHNVAIDFGRNRVHGSDLLGDCAKRWHEWFLTLQ